MRLSFPPRRPGRGQSLSSARGQPDQPFAAVRASDRFDPALLLQQFQIARQGRLVEIEPPPDGGLVRLAEPLEHRQEGELRPFDAMRAQPLVVELGHGTRRATDSGARAWQDVNIGRVTSNHCWFSHAQGMSLIEFSTSYV